MRCLLMCVRSDQISTTCNHISRSNAMTQGAILIASFLLKSRNTNNTASSCKQ